jgi:hypothetical protein
MKTKTALLRWFTVAAMLLAACNIVSAAGYLTIFTDSWKDAGTNESASTPGSFTINLSVPLGGVDLREADTNSQFLLGISVFYNSFEIASNTLGNAENYSAGDTSATFPITALNGDGNEVTNGSVTVSWTATNITVTGSASCDLLEEGANFAYNSQNFSAKSTSFGFDAAVSLILDASDNGGGTFDYYNPFLRVNGHNSQKADKPPDGSSPDYLETGSETGAEILTPPKLTISSPAPNFKVYDADPVVNLIGNASDSLGITNIQCYVNGDTTNPVSIDQSYELPTNQVSWTAEVDLSQFGHVGTNVISVIAQDAAGNQIIVSRAFLWIETNSAVVTVIPAGAGTVKGIKNGQVLQVNNGYVVAATPANKNWIFSEWTDGSGDALSSNASFEYFDENGTWTNSSSPTLVAKFVPNPFTNAGLVGTYTGLFYDAANGLQLSDAGYITVTVTEAGDFSGKLYLATTASPFSFSGQLSEATGGSSAVAELQVKVSKSEYLALHLSIATDPNLTNAGAGDLSGFVTAYSNPAETSILDTAVIQGKLCSYNSNIVAGTYNLVMSLSGFEVSPSGSVLYPLPGGFSYGSATVNKKGEVAVVINLADGTSRPFSFSGAMARDGTCPIYAPLYGGKGVILGWIQFATDGSGIIEQSSVSWLKPPVADNYYTGGFLITPNLSGSLYIRSKPGTNIFGATDLAFAIDEDYPGFPLPSPTNFAVTFNPVNGKFSGVDEVTITLTPTTGALTGFFHSSGRKAPYNYHGIEVNGSGFGFFTDPAAQQTGSIWIGLPANLGQSAGGGSGITITRVPGGDPALPPPVVPESPVGTGPPQPLPQE